MSKFVSDTAAGKSLSAYVILNPKGQHVATVKAHFSNAGVCLVNVHCTRDGFQYARASGYGYDKFTAALSGLTIDGHKMSDHCSKDGAPKPPRGRVTFPSGHKPRKGYALANYASVSRKTGRAVHSYHWIDEAKAALGYSPALLEKSDDAAVWDAICERAAELEKAWRASDDCEQGYTSCYRLSGLDYLKDLGYRVIQAV